MINTFPVIVVGSETGEFLWLLPKRDRLIILEVNETHKKTAVVIVVDEFFLSERTINFPGVCKSGWMSVTPRDLGIRTEFRRLFRPKRKGFFLYISLFRVFVVCGDPKEKVVA